MQCDRESVRLLARDTAIARRGRSRSSGTAAGPRVARRVEVVRLAEEIRLVVCEMTGELIELTVPLRMRPEVVVVVQGAEPERGEARPNRDARMSRRTPARTRARSVPGPGWRGALHSASSPPMPPRGPPALARGRAPGGLVRATTGSTSRVSVRRVALPSATPSRPRAGRPGCAASNRRRGLSRRAWRIFGPGLPREPQSGGMASFSRSGARKGQPQEVGDARGLDRGQRSHDLDPLVQRCRGAEPRSSLDAAAAARSPPARGSPGSAASRRSRGGQRAAVAALSPSRSTSRSSASCSSRVAQRPEEHHLGARARERGGRAERRQPDRRRTAPGVSASTSGSNARAWARRTASSAATATAPPSVSRYRSPGPPARRPGSDPGPRLPRPAPPPRRCAAAP